MFAAQLDALEAHDARGRLASLDLPATVVAAERDILVPVNRTQALLAELQQGRGVVVPGGHACFWERPGGLSRAITNAVAGPSSRRRL